MEHIVLHKSTAHGSYGVFGIEIIVSATKLPNMKIDTIQKAKYTSTKLLTSAICEAIKNENPKTIEETKKNKELITKVFPDNIFVEEISNKYCADWCCTHLPWFIVTTKIGRITIGWRKRVILIDWEGTSNPATAKALFNDEDTTKSGRSIHAWSIEKAVEYIKVILDIKQLKEKQLKGELSDNETC